MRIKPLLSSVLLTVLCAGCVPSQSAQQQSSSSVAAGENLEMYGPVIPDLSAEPVDFSFVGLKGDPMIRKRMYPSMNDVKEIVEANKRGEKCEPRFSDARIEVLQNAYKNTTSMKYTVVDTTRAKGSVFTVWLLPNVGYETKEMVEEDWNICAVGVFGFVELNEKWVAFVMRNSWRDFTDEPDVESYMKTIKLR